MIYRLGGVFLCVVRVVRLIVINLVGVTAGITGPLLIRAGEPQRPDASPLRIDRQAEVLKHLASDASDGFGLSGQRAGRLLEGDGGVF